MVDKVHALTAHAMSRQDTTAMVEQLNRMLRGLENYFQIGQVSRAHRVLDRYTATRFRRWLRHRHKVRRRRGGSYQIAHRYGHFGRLRLKARGCDQS